MNPSRIIVAAVVFGLVIVLAVSGYGMWQSMRSAATEKRVERAQSGATVESAKDAIATQGAAQERETASEELTKTNEKEIRHAEGANEPLPGAVTAAGRDSLCRRASYRSSKYCLQRSTPAGVDQGR